MKYSRFAWLALVAGLFVSGARTASAQYQYLGEIRMVGFYFNPIGWEECDGQLLPINQNQALFSLLGTTYGGDGVNNFALPNLQGRFPMHMGSSNTLGSSTHLIGQAGGAEAYVLTVAQLPAHSHPLFANTAVGSVLAAEGNQLGSGGVVPIPGLPKASIYVPGNPNVNTTNAALDVHSIGSTGSNQPVTVTPPYLTVNFIIAIEGIFPARE